MSINSAIWLDSVRAVPAVGLKFKSSFDTPATLISRVKALLQKWDGEFGGINVSIEQDFAVKIERPDGVEIKLTPDQVSCRFFYISTFEEKGHSQAVVRYQSDRRPFAELMRLVTEVLGSVITELWKDGNRALSRVGVVAHGNLDPDALPPGFEMYSKHLASLWPLGTLQSKSEILAKLSEDEKTIERCHHLVETPLSDDAVVSFKLDWQRLWKNADAPAAAVVRKSTDDAVTSAISYFGKFGLGDLCYADVK